jgi:branched-chain amino acid transport system ATP-binding protein
MKRGDDQAILDIRNLAAGYEALPVIADLSVPVRDRAITMLIGHNGAGKSTLAKCIVGTVPLRRGSIHFDGQPIEGLSVRQRLARGIVLILQERAVFAELSVTENLQFAGMVRRQGDGAMSHDAIWSLFPALAEARQRLAGGLSGGQQRMLAIAMGLMTNPRFLILDEPSLGLSPKLVDEVMQQTRAICTQTGVTVLLIEQNIEAALQVADHVVAIRNGALIFTGRRQDLKRHSDVMALL